MNPASALLDLAHSFESLGMKPPIVDLRGDGDMMRLVREIAPLAPIEEIFPVRLADGSVVQKVTICGVEVRKVLTGPRQRGYRGVWL